MRRAIWSPDWNLAHNISKLDWLFQPTFVHKLLLTEMTILQVCVWICVLLCTQDTD